LPPPPPDFGGPQVFSLQATPWSAQVEPAGKAFEFYARVVQGQATLSHTQITAVEEDVEDDAEAEKYAHHKKARDPLLGIAELDYYELLGLGETRWLSTPEDIKKAYRKMSLLLHPDKQAHANQDIDEEVFKNLTKAYETLSNPKLKRAYDSKEPFDNSIPSSSQIKTDEDFYTIFGKAFERNTKWSINRMPKLGDQNTSIQDTNRFYQVWYSFKSWRDYGYLDEYDPETAECREEKRWMEKKNAKERQKHEREEASRINSLIDLAYKLDPRIKKQLEEERAVKEAARQRRVEAANQKKEEEERVKREALEKEEAARRKEEEAKKAEQEERTRVNNAKKKRRQKLRQTARKFECPEADVEWLVSQLVELDQLNEICARLDAVQNPTKESLTAFFASEVAANKAKAAEDAKARAEAEAKEKQSTTTDKVVWTNEEIHLLLKAVNKFPTGSRERWARIGEFIGGGKTEKQIIARVKAGVVGQDDAYQKWLREKKQVARDTDSSGGTQNYEAAATDSPKPQKAVATPAPAPTPVAAAATPETTATPAAEPEWTPEDQKLLEAALRKFPASLGKDRWAKIAEAVPGKNRRDCVERYKVLVSAVQQKKG